MLQPTALTRILCKNAVEAVLCRLLPLLLLAAVEELATNPLPTLVIGVHVEALVALLIIIVQVRHGGCCWCCGSPPARRRRRLPPLQPPAALGGLPALLGAVEKLQIDCGAFASCSRQRAMASRLYRK